MQLDLGSSFIRTLIYIYLMQLIYILFIFPLGKSFCELLFKRAYYSSMFQIVEGDYTQLEGGTYSAEVTLVIQRYTGRNFIV